MQNLVNSLLKNWQTSLCGIIVFVSLVGGELGLPPRLVKAATTIATAYGLLAAKQQNVTGGTVFQGDSIQAAQQKAVQSAKIVNEMVAEDHGKVATVAAETPKPTP